MKKTSKIGIGATATLAAVAGMAGYVTFNEIMNRNAKFTPFFEKIFAKPNENEAHFDGNQPDERKDWFYAQNFEKHEILSERGERLKGYFLKADKPSNVYFFGVHGYRGDAKREFCYMSKFYHDKGYNIFLIDHQASGESDGKYISFGHFEHQNCMKWLDYMLEVFGKDIQIILHGVSMGSATSMLLTGDENLPANVKFTVADCGYTSMYNQFYHNLGEGKLAKPTLAALSGINKMALGFGLKDVSPIDAVKNAKIPMLFIHGGSDDFVPSYMVHELYDACASEYKDKLIVDRAGHAMSYVINTQAYEAKLNEFIEKFIEK